METIFPEMSIPYSLRATTIIASFNLSKSETRAISHELYVNFKYPLFLFLSPSKTLTLICLITLRSLKL